MVQWETNDVEIGLCEGGSGFVGGGVGGGGGGGCGCDSWALAPPRRAEHSCTMQATKCTVVVYTLLTSLTQLALVTAQCPVINAPCRCAPSINEPVAIVCENAGSLSNALQAIQSARSVSIDSLSIIDTAVATIPANVFMGFTILRLVLNRNTLQFIDDQAFNGPLLDSLVELDLSDNNLGQIPQTGLPRLRNLRKLI
ncbi:hypothetical protein KIN20_014692 [Parelaphostrongylus tenuis]|uniref:Uncharacterized protein n=1 Tax=Parelaphostrongylus tenuis TaxID=148309 RepID=A0AAD5MIM5_PARTN|nr:hypothetical protein KIN20_014692 [Parelaphostrongylus tenuis]